MQNAPNGFPPGFPQQQQAPAGYQQMPQQQAAPPGFPQQTQFQQPTQQMPQQPFQQQSPPPGSYLQQPGAAPQGFSYAPDIPDDLFERIANSSATATGVYMRDGNYMLAIKECKYVKAFGGWTWVTKFVVVEAVRQEGMLQLGGEPCAPGTPNAAQVEPNQPGEEVDFTSPVENSRIPNAAGNVKAFLLALTNTSESQFNPAEFKKACGLLVQPSQPMRGALIMCVTKRKVNQGRNVAANKGKILVMPTWTHISHNADEIKQRRFQIEQGLRIPPLARTGA